MKNSLRGIKTSIVALAFILPFGANAGGNEHHQPPQEQGGGGMNAQQQVLVEQQVQLRIQQEAQARANAETNVHVRTGDVRTGDMNVRTGDTNVRTGDTTLIGGTTTVGGTTVGATTATAAGGAASIGSIAPVQTQAVQFVAPPPAPGAHVNPLIGVGTPSVQRGGVNVGAMALGERYLDSCASNFNSGQQAMDIVTGKSASRMSEVTFTPNANYGKYGNGTLGMTTQVLPLASLAGRKTAVYSCLGFLTIEARADDAGRVNVAMLEQEALRFAGVTLKGFPRAYLVRVPGAFNMNVGLSNSADGFGISAGGSKLFNAGALLGTVLGGINMSGSNSFAVGQAGVAYIMVTDVLAADAANIDLGTPEVMVPTAAPDPRIAQLEEENRRLRELPVAPQASCVTPPKAPIVGNKRKHVIIDDCRKDKK